MTILEALKSISNYPIPQFTLNRVAVDNGIVLTEEATGIVMTSSGFRTAEAQLKLWIASAPSISEGGVSFSLSKEERDQLKREALSMLLIIGTPARSPYGYKGESL